MHLSKTMMTHGESAAQTRRGILLSNSAASGGQGHPPHPSSPAGWVEAGKKADGRGEEEMGGEEWRGGKNKSNVDRMWEINDRVGCDQRTWLS